MSDVGAIILAAGMAKRFTESGGVGASKLVAQLAGAPLVRHVANAALASQARPILVVTGHAAQEVETALSGLALTFVFNSDYAAGLATSLRCGLAALPMRATGALILLADMPEISAALLDRLINAFGARPKALAVAPIFQGQRGNPVLLSRALFAQVAKLRGDEGARRLLASAAKSDLVEITADDDAATLDIDTIGALSDARARFRR